MGEGKQTVMRHTISTILLLLSIAVSACAQDVPVAPQKKLPDQPDKPKPARIATPKLPPDQNKFAVIITGIGGEEAYVKQFADWTAQLRAAMIEQLGFADERITILTEKPEGSEQRSSAEVVRQTFVALRNTLKPDNQLFIFFIGHGSFDGKVAKFNLIGPDLSANDYAQLISPLPARQIVIVNTASASGEFVKPLSGAGRIVVTATRSGMEQNAPHFGEHFIAALGNSDADADKNSRVSVLEAFEYASKLTAGFYEQKGRLATEHSLLDDNGDGTGHSKAEAGDGALARTTYFDSLPQQQAGGNAELAKLFAERLRLEGEIEQLKVRKAQMKEEEYEDALEKMLIELAKLNLSIKAKQKS
ncbi:MAG: hypothetical protein ACREEM_24810 [Blastocatellia bacterium]